MTRRWIARLDAIPWLRRALFLGVGLAVFLLGATYLSLRYPPDVPSFMVIGSGWVASGEPTSLRVRARTLDGRSANAVTITGVAAGGREIAFEQQDDDPATVSFRVPVVPDAPRTLTLAVTARAGERTETLMVPLEVLAGDPEADAFPAPQPKLPDSLKPFHLSLVPEGAGVVARLDNQIFVKVRDATGRAVEGATVTLTHSALPDGKLTLVSDANGLADFSLHADRPSYTLRMKVKRGAEEAEFAETIVPGGRQALLRAPAPVLRPGEREEVELMTWRRSGRAFCDLRRGPVWIWSRSLDLSTKGHGIEVGPLAPGRFDLQCYFHAHTPGVTWATVPIVVGDGAPLELLARKVETTAVVHPEALALHPGGRPELAAGYFLALLNQAPVMPTLLVNTKTATDKAREEAWDAKKRLVLILLGAMFVLIVLVVFDLILGNILSQRDRMRAYEADLAADTGDAPGEGDALDGDEFDDLLVAAHKDRSSLVRTRGLVLVVLVGGTIIANLVAFIVLMVLIR